MKPTLLRLVIVLVPCVALAGLIVAARLVDTSRTRHPLSYHRIRRGILRALSSGVLMR